MEKQAQTKFGPKRLLRCLDEIEGEPLGVADCDVVPVLFIKTAHSNAALANADVTPHSIFAFAPMFSVYSVINRWMYMRRNRSNSAAS
jgi:hypothetical protein